MLWIEIVLKSQHICVIDSRITTEYFKVNRGACQGDAVSAFLFILALQILFHLIKENPLMNE